MRIGQSEIRRLPVHQVEHTLKQIDIGASSYGTTMMKRSAPKVTLWTAITVYSGDECCCQQAISHTILFRGKMGIAKVKQVRALAMADTFMQGTSDPPYTML